MRTPRLGRGRCAPAATLRVGLPVAAVLLVSALPATAASADRPLPDPRAATAVDADRVDRATTEGRAGGPAFVPGEVIVGFEPGAGRNARAAARSAARTAVKRGLEVPRAQLLRIRGDRAPEAVARTLERRPEVDYAEPNHYVHASEVLPDDPGFPVLWGLSNPGALVHSQAGVAGGDISAPRAWEASTGSEDVTVAVVDTGVDAAHPDLAANIVAGGWDFVDGDPDPGDEQGHGTHVAGTIGAVGNNGEGVTGVAWEVGLMPIRVLDETGEGTMADVAAGFEHAAQRGAEIVNASLGGAEESELLDTAIAAATETLFVVAAGNDGSDNDATPTYPCNSPLPNVICVAATDQRDRLAGFSNHGLSSVDLAAPGVDIYSAAAAGTEREYLFEGFEEALAGRWETTGAWGRAGAAAFSGEWGLTDSPGAQYAAGAHSWADSPEFSLAGGSGCELAFRAIVDVDPSDLFLVDVSTDGFESYDSFLVPPAAAWTPIHADLSGFDGEPEVQVSFRLFADDDQDVADGARIDDVSVRCASPEPGYDFKSGTSMATPHVAGAAALIASAQPDATAAELGKAIVDGVDGVAGLNGKVATGGRLNAARSLGLAAVAATPPPRTRWVMRPPRVSRLRVNRFRFRSPDDAAGFRCRFNRGPWRSCAAPRVYRNLRPRRHVFRVVAVDEAGNVGNRRLWRFRVVR